MKKRLLNIAAAVTTVTLTFSILAAESISDSHAAIKNSLQRIVSNLEHPHITPGAIIASPSQSEPNYFYHWTRDAGLVVLTLMSQSEQYPHLIKHIRNWGRFERFAQQESYSGEGLGEPKFFVNGKVFDGPWGRPQNDGPAIRSLAYLRAFHKIDKLVQEDVDYTIRNWRNANIDLWEEVRGHHFFTRYAQMTLLRYTAVHYQAQMQESHAQGLLREAAVIEKSLQGFADRSRRIIVPTLAEDYEGLQKPAGLDISVILAMNYFGTTSLHSGESGFWTYSQPFLMNTALQLSETFQQLYEINRKFPNMAPGIGRYPEDVYDGNGFSGGNPWYLATFGMAEYYCALAQELLQNGSLNTDPISQTFFLTHNPKFQKNPRDPRQNFLITVKSLLDRADSFMDRANFHSGRDGRMAEQFDRGTGFQRGARDLTWSYASRIRAHARCLASHALYQKAVR